MEKNLGLSILRQVGAYRESVKRFLKKYEEKKINRRDDKWDVV
jgi:hypothetical protein